MSEMTPTERLRALQQQWRDGPYALEVEKGGCEHCSAGRSWLIVRDDIALGTSFDVEEDAQDLADELNHAASQCADALDPILEAIPAQQNVALYEAQAGMVGLIQLLPDEQRRPLLDNHRFVTALALVSQLEGRVRPEGGDPQT